MTTQTPQRSCPSLCTRDDHTVDIDGGRLHHGPRFGAIDTWAYESVGGELEPATAFVDKIECDAATLRQLAADAAAATEWLES